MLEKIKEYIIAAGALTVSILYFILNKRTQQLKDAQLENATLKTEKELGSIADAAQDSRDTYNHSLEDYNAFRRKYGGGFGQGGSDPKSNS